MRRYGVLKTISPAERREKSLLLPDPKNGFVAIFKWPYIDGIHTVINRVDEKHNARIGEILLSESAHGFLSVHFAILDYFCATNNLSLEIVRHEYRLLDESGQIPSHFYETILAGEWKQTKTPEKKQ